MPPGCWRFLSVAGLAFVGIAAAASPVASQDNVADLWLGSSIEGYCRDQEQSDDLLGQAPTALNEEQQYIQDQLCTLCVAGDQTACGMLVDLIEPAAGPVDPMGQPDDLGYDDSGYGE